MTILVSVLCEDGIVMGIDSMISIGPKDRNFIGDCTGEKIVDINQELVVSCAGNSNLISSFVSFLENSYEEIKNNSNNEHSLFQKIGSEFTTKYVENLKSHPDIVNEGLLNDIRQNGFDFEATIGLIFGDNHYLCSYDNRFMPHLKRKEETWCEVLGSAKSVALPSIQLVKKLLNVVKKPTTYQASLLVYWTIQHTIEAGSGGTGGLIKIKIIKKEKTGHSISDAITSENEEVIKNVYSAVHSYLSN